VTQQVAQAYTDLTQAQVLAASYQTDILVPSGTLLTAARAGYQQGGTGLLPVLDAESTLRNARTGYVSSLLALYKAQDELQTAAGEAPTAIAAAPTDHR
jgi:outer membrane protein TolC